MRRSPFPPGPNRVTFASSMKIQINGEERDFNAASHTLAALVDSLGMKPDRVAIELNRDIVPRDQWTNTTLTDGDKLEVVHFVGGGAPAEFHTCDSLNCDNRVDGPDGAR